MATKSTLETVSVAALYATGGIVVTLSNLQKVTNAVVSKADSTSYVPAVNVIGSTGALAVKFGTVGTVSGDWTELAAAFGSVVATVTVYAEGY